ncbi:SDR family oxidoreductase [Kribbella monticola]|uniref:SDR family oxidoreductase n=1 Tax=Kribbella monticola TaxID=2185285 RepID=UPI000DD4C2FA|nr:SDR family oxidoreductase [Kribbella monticola]
MRRNILITGASAGLGAEMARQFAAKGRNLVLTARREDRLKTLQDELTTAHPGIEVVVRRLDVTDHDQVFEVFRSADAELGGLDRVIVNAGIGKGTPIGTGRFDANLATTMTNYVAALAQAEAAMELFRARNAGHLVLISSVAGLRGMPKAMTAYSASKSAIAAVGEGLQLELLGKPIKVSVIQPGYIRSDLNEGVRKLPFVVDTEPGVRAMVAAIEAERAKAVVPSWPWRPLSSVLKVVPVSLLKRVI